MSTSKRVRSKSRNSGLSKSGRREKQELGPHRPKRFDFYRSWSSLIRERYIPLLTTHLKTVFLNRQYWIFIYTTSLACYLLWDGVLPDSEFVELCIWLFILYFAGNVFHSIANRYNKKLPVSQRRAGSKFFSVVVILLFIQAAVLSGVLSVEYYTTLTIWMTGLYFGIDVASIYAYRSFGLGRMDQGQSRGMSRLFSGGRSLDHDDYDGYDEDVYDVEDRPRARSMVRSRSTYERQIPSRNRRKYRQRYDDTESDLDLDEPVSRSELEDIVVYDESGNPVKE